MIQKYSPNFIIEVYICAMGKLSPFYIFNVAHAHLFVFYFVESECCL